jgi:Tat protein secretion system quality control protein TatD with DNase activity
MRWQQNEPAYITYVYNKLCELLNINSNDLYNTIEENTNSLYFP